MMGSHHTLCKNSGNMPPTHHTHTNTHTHTHTHTHTYTVIYLDKNQSLLLAVPSLNLSDTLFLLFSNLILDPLFINESSLFCSFTNISNSHVFKCQRPSKQRTISTLFSTDVPLTVICWAAGVVKVCPWVWYCLAYACHVSNTVCKVGQICF